VIPLSSPFTPEAQNVVVGMLASMAKQARVHAEVAPDSDFVEYLLRLSDRLEEDKTAVVEDGKLNLIPERKDAS
jgi:hypothetical protein